jgi:hypothetical protein
VVELEPVTDLPPVLGAPLPAQRTSHDSLLISLPVAGAKRSRPLFGATAATAAAGAGAAGPGTAGAAAREAKRQHTMDGSPSGAAALFGGGDQGGEDAFGAAFGRPPLPPNAADKVRVCGVAPGDSHRAPSLCCAVAPGESSHVCR